MQFEIWLADSPFSLVPLLTRQQPQELRSRTEEFTEVLRGMQQSCRPGYTLVGALH